MKVSAVTGKKKGDNITYSSGQPATTIYVIVQLLTATIRPHQRTTRAYITLLYLPRKK